MLPNPSLYMHFPWCVKKCPYCDFNSHPSNGDIPQEAYASALIYDLEKQSNDLFGYQRFATVFIGGGTPSLFDPCQLDRVFEAIDLTADAEVTMEANPGTTERFSFSAYRSIGINRLSIGAQSFDDEHLQVLGRIHEATHTAAAFQTAREAGFENINVDLMWGLPQQTTAQAMQDLSTAIALSPEHISWYQLTLEPRTEFAKRPPIIPVEPILAEIESEGLALLESSGFERYEISGFAKPGFTCAHNLNYWRFGDYVGIGAGAHGKCTSSDPMPVQVARTNKAKQPRLYLQRATDIDINPVIEDALPLEFMMNALRLVDGVSQELFAQRTGIDWHRIDEVWSNLAERGLVCADRCAATTMGMRYLDTVLGEFVN